MTKKTTAKKAAKKTKTAAKKKVSAKAKKTSKAKTKTSASKKTAQAKTKAKAKSKAKVKAKTKVKASAKTTARKKSASTTAKKSAKKKTAPRLSQREKVIQMIKQDLISQRESLLKEAEETLSNLPSELNFPDMGDQASAETDRNFMLRLRDRERMLLKKIEETIERIDGEDYGICEECGCEIGVKRLEARPVTTYCIECKTRQEEEERIAEGT